MVLKPCSLRWSVSYSIYLFALSGRFAMGAIAALVHDVIITTGLFIISEREISAGVLAALLTIIGYSLNDTIIVFDRVRENLGLAYKSDSERKAKKRSKKKDSAMRSLTEMNFTELLNFSINQTLSRTLLTSVTTLFVVGSLWLYGGGAISDLAFALVIGVIVGTYSSIFVACTTILFLAKERTEAA